MIKPRLAGPAQPLAVFADSSVAPAALTQSRLLRFAAAFLFLFSVNLTLAPAVRLHSWQADYPLAHWLGFAVWLAGFTILHRQLVKLIPEADPFLLPAAALLSGWGLLTIWRIDSTLGLKQTLWLAIAIVIFGLGLRLRRLLPLLRRYKYLWLTCGLLLTILTFFIGTYPNGSGPGLWLKFGGIYLQPSEPLKLLFIIYLASYLADHLPVSFRILPLLAPTFLIIAVALVVLVAQRDLGTASIFLIIYTATLYLTFGRKRLLGISLLTLAGAGFLGYRLFDVVRLRVDAWLNPWLDPAGRSYQIVQSLMAIASGGVLGRGPGLGSPGLVPVAASDFIFSAITEETGLIGAIGILLLIALLVGRTFTSALASTNNFQRYLASSLGTYLAAQSILIIGGNLRLLPLTGVTLPFVSYGGSSLLTAFAALLILVNIHPRSENEPAPLPKPAPYLVVSGVAFFSLMAIGVLVLWWGLFRQNDLLDRTDNLRRIITDRYVQRGSVLDRNNRPISQTTGQPGSYQREYLYPALSPITGYNDPSYGQAGLEASQDSYLRGLQGAPSHAIWWEYLVYGQPPPGLNLRLSINLDIQEQADTLLAGHKGSVVLLNAVTGEIISMSSQPAFDPNNLDETWNAIVSSSDAPLLNRAVQGQYPPGPILAPFLLADALSFGGLPSLPASLGYTLPDSTRMECAADLPETYTWGDIIRAGCPAAPLWMGKRYSPDELSALFQALGFSDASAVGLPAAAPVNPSINSAELASVGQENLLVTPLQMALAAAAISNEGIQPSPLLSLSVETPHQAWVALPHGTPHTALPSAGVSTALNLLTHPGELHWQSVALAYTPDTPITWYLAGTTTKWRGTPIAVAVVLEENNPALAETIGRALITTVVSGK